MQNSESQKPNEHVVSNLPAIEKLSKPKTSVDVFIEHRASICFCLFSVAWWIASYFVFYATIIITLILAILEALHIPTDDDLSFWGVFLIGTVVSGLLYVIYLIFYGLARFFQKEIK